MSRVPVGVLAAASLMIAACSTAPTESVDGSSTPTAESATTATAGAEADEQAQPSADESATTESAASGDSASEDAGSEDVTETTAPPVTEAPVETTADDGVPSVFSGEFQTLSGETFDLGSLEGQDVVLWFWAPW